MLYTVKEVSEILKTNVDYVHKLRKSGLLPFIKLGSYKVRKESVEEFLKVYEGKDLTDPFNIKGLEDEAI
jgi:excisionase family DNA binding protein